MSQITRPLVAVLALVGLWFLAMVLEALRTPVWTLAMIGGLLLVNLIMLIASVHQATREPGGGEGSGGPPTPRPDTPDSGGGDEPSWWPELERELARYLAEHPRDDRSPERVPVGSV